LAWNPWLCLMRYSIANRLVPVSFFGLHWLYL
jgi:hypothetical protein